MKYLMVLRALYAPFCSTLQLYLQSPTADVDCTVCLRHFGIKVMSSRAALEIFFLPMSIVVF